MKIIGTKYENITLDESKTSCYGDKKTINVVFYKDMFGEGAVKLLLDKLHIWPPKRINEFMNTECAITRYAIDYDFEEQQVLGDEEVDTENTTALYIRVGEDESKFYAIVMGIPFPREYSFKDKDSFDEYLKRCPFKLRVLKIVA